MSNRKRALVTAAGTGIGRAVAVSLAEAGFDVAVTPRDLESMESLATVIDLVERAGGRAMALPLDIVDPVSVGTTAATLLERWDGVDVVVHNARHLGPGHHETLMDGSLDHVANHLQGNFLSPMALNRALVPAMTAHGGGVILNLDSTAAYSDPVAAADAGGWGLSYGASKAALHRSAGILARELERSNVVCINVDPGTVKIQPVTDPGDRRLSGLDGPHAAAVGRVCAFLATDHEAAARYNGLTVFAQFLADERGLVPGWQGPKRGPSRTAVPDPAPGDLSARLTPPATDT